MKRTFKDLLPHLIVLVIFIITSLAYFNPVLQGKKIYQGDIVQYTGMSKQHTDYREETGKETYWTDAAFGGMPTYQLGAKYPHNYIKQIDLALRFLPRPADYLFLYFIAMYILLLVLKVEYKLAFLGAIAFGFSTYLIIILGVGHNAKAHAIAYMPLVLSGIILTFRGKYLFGFLLTAVALGLELVANHFQMTYYLLLLVLIVGAVYLIDAIKKKRLKKYGKAVLILIAGVIVAVGMNATNILATKEYADTSTRGKTELTISPDGTPKADGTTGGLDYEYITEYSYGLLESFNLYVPRFMGGGSSDSFPEDSKTIDTLIKMGASPQEANEILQQLPVYWGEQPIVAAPAYIGAVVIFLALLALFLIRGRLKWWISAAFILSLFLSWGKHFPVLTDFFINNVPLYNKFRAVSSIQVIIELVLPILAVVGLHKFFCKDEETDIKKKALFYAGIILGGLTLIFILFKSVIPGLDFASPYDSLIREQLGTPLMDAVREDRIKLFNADALRSLVFIGIAFLLLWGYLRAKLLRNTTIFLVTVLILIDLVAIDRRYVNNDDFAPASLVEQPFEKHGADIQILEDEGHFRVYDVSGNAPFTSGRASYFHNALGGYHAAKPGRMQEIDEFYLSSGNVGILNMMNVRYIITRGQNGGPVAQRNPYANGNAWLVENVMIAENANEEMLLLDSLNTRTTAVIHKEFKSQIPSKEISRDTTATIELVSYSPGHLVYEASTTSPQLAIFSEVYYPHGWQVYINNQPATYFRANYVLRAMQIPAGYNKIEFRFEPEVIHTGSTISLISFMLLTLAMAGGIYFRFRRNRKEIIQQE